MLSAGSKIAFQGAYADGAIAYSGAGSPAWGEQDQGFNTNGNGLLFPMADGVFDPATATSTSRRPGRLAAQFTWKVSPNFEIDPEVSYASVEYDSSARRLWTDLAAEGDRVVGRRGVRLVAGQEPRLRPRRDLRVVASVDAGFLGPRRTADRSRTTPTASTAVCTSSARSDRTPSGRKHRPRSESSGVFLSLASAKGADAAPVPRTGQTARASRRSLAFGGLTLPRSPPRPLTREAVLPTDPGLVARVKPEGRPNRAASGDPCRRSCRLAALHAAPNRRQRQQPPALIDDLRAPRAFCIQAEPLSWPSPDLIRGLTRPSKRRRSAREGRRRSVPSILRSITVWMAGSIPGSSPGTAMTQSAILDQFQFALAGARRRSAAPAASPLTAWRKSPSRPRNPENSRRGNSLQVSRGALV